MRRSFPHSSSIPFALSRFSASSYVMRSNGGLTAFRNSGVRPTAPLTFALVSALLAAVLSVATYAPALQALRADPIAALRAE